MEPNNALSLERASPFPSNALLRNQQLANACRVCHLQFGTAIHPFSTPRIHHRKDRCLPCGEKMEAENINSKRKKLREQPCAACLEPLGDSLPSSAYLRNSHKTPHSRRCHRCLAGCAPLCSRSLRTVSLRLNDFQNAGMPTLGGKALCVVLKHIGLSSIYRVPWRNGLPRIALFLGSKYTQPYANKHGGVTREPRNTFMDRLETLGKEKWHRRGGCVTTRICCGYAGWWGFRCNKCGRLRNITRPSTV